MRFGPSHLALRTLQLSSRRPLTTMSAGITEREKFEFDLNGFLVLRNVLSAEEVASANAAIDAHAVSTLEHGPCRPSTNDSRPAAAEMLSPVTAYTELRAVGG